MELIEDIKNSRGFIKNCIEHYGFSAEHNLEHFECSARTNEKHFIFREDGFCILSFYNTKTNVFRMFSEVIAPEDKREELFFKFLDLCLTKRKAEKVAVELEESFRKKILEALDKRGLEALKINYMLEWPIFKMSEFDEKLEGKKFKNLRNIWNRYTKDSEVKIVGVHDASKKELKSLVKRWVKQRKTKERAYYQQFLNQIDIGFSGCNSTRICVIKSKPVAITAGWKIPNSNNYYSGIGIYDYDYDHLGDFVNLDDLKELKKKNYDFVDFGGSDKGLLDFKQKFVFQESYKTYIFSIVKKTKD